MILLGKEHKAFIHDSDSCIFLAHIQKYLSRKPCDLYISTSDNPCLIARYSHEPSDNITYKVSDMTHIDLEPLDDITLAYQLAEMQGHLD